ncbi:NUDIX domain-containing protein [Candidatus Pacearchaeota archaeon]|nr:NUDIX domain-containing protein [Candidatus Pacearchaeota archaeon]
MKQKILSFIYNKEKNKFLLLNMAKHPDHAPEGRWFTVAERVEKDESSEDAVRKEIKDEIGLTAEEIFPLNWGSTYKWKGEEFKEMNFMAFVNSDKIILNKKNSKYKWFNIDKFIEKIEWNDNTTLLKKVLEKGINKEAYFDKKERGQ